MNHHKETVMIDFDGTISPFHGFEIGPKLEVIESIKALHKKFKIGIYSCRSNRNVCDRIDEVKMIEYLKKYDIPYDFIESGKPVFIALIDDRAYNPHHIGWDNILKMFDINHSKPLENKSSDAHGIIVPAGSDIVSPNHNTA